jgi:mono/diheme cytochrome c family protein
MRALLGVLLLLPLPLPAPGGQDGKPGDGSVRFNRDVRPILAENCFLCHGPDPGTRKGKLRLDREEGYFGKRENGVMVVPGKPAESPLFHHLTTKDPDDLMPPPKSKKVLKPAEIAIIRKWIEQGARWEPHWAFLKPERPAPPAVKDAAWVRNPVDRFILARLESAGLKPAPEADRRTLARRLSLDLTGLPPSAADVEAFVADRAPDAYEKLVERLLASPAWGEHRGRAWMDAARYADTHGLHFDNFRDIWPYRDWIVKAFNRNQPFDQFTIEQLAGDLLPDPTPDQLIATGFHRCNITTNEGGSINEEVLALYARDRVETTSWVWLGLTANCAVCHDHKFDPVDMKDFYAMSAFFRNTTQGAMDGNIRDTAPVMVLPKAEDEKRWAAVPAEIAAAQKTADGQRKRLRLQFDEWIKTAKPEDWDVEVAKIGEPDLHLPLDREEPADALRGTGKGAPLGVRSATPVAWEPGLRDSKALRFEGKGAVEVDGDVGAFGRQSPFSFGAWVKVLPGFQGAAPVFARMDDDEAYRGWDLWIQGSEFASHLIHKWQGDAIKVATTGNRVKPGQWQHVFVTYDGSSKAEGFRIYVDGGEAKLKVEANTLKNDTLTSAPFRVGQRKKGPLLSHAAVQDVRIYGRLLKPGEVRSLALQNRARDLLARAPRDRKPKELDELFQATSGSDPVLSAATDRVAALEAERKAIRERASVAYIQEEKKNSMPMAAVLFRGDYSKPKEKVEADVIKALHPLPPGAPRNRLGLAQWLVSPENPLTARVTVNRLWQEVFGTGIVKTSEDFGIMGEAPSHPELLDWLAVEFRDGGWDVKRFFRLVVGSATYRQAARATPEKIEKDRDNRLLSRGPRFRMDAEMVRDYALAVSGLLSPKLGGPSVRPYQPEGVWDIVGMPGSNTRDYRPDAGEGLYRRSLYTFWKRAAPPPAMEILNAPAREFSCLRRERTNTPLQALVTLNDPQFVEAARQLAHDVLLRHADPSARLDAMFRTVLLRPLAADEKAVLERGLAALRAHYAAKPEDAKALNAVGVRKPDPQVDPSELAAWTLVGNQLLNLDEVLNK